MESTPKMTFCVVMYNEEGYIGKLLENIKSQTYPHDKIELIFVDGKSTDSTKSIVADFIANATGYADIKLLDNDKRILCAGLNIGITNATTEIFIRVDAHSTVSPDFIEKNIANIVSGEDICGGQYVHVLNNPSLGKKILLLADKSMFGSGIGDFKREGSKRYVTTLANGCYRKEVFDKIGLYDETLVRTEDNDIHYRMREAGYKILLDGDIKFEFQTRSTLKGMLKQKYGNGKWIGITCVKKTPKMFSIYHFVPMAFVICAIIAMTLFGCSFIAAPLWWLALPFYIGIGLYLTLTILLSAITSLQNKNYLAFIPLIFLFPLLHFTYGIATCIGLIRGLFPIK